MWWSHINNFTRLSKQRASSQLTVTIAIFKLSTRRPRVKTMCEPTNTIAMHTHTYSAHIHTQNDEKFSLDTITKGDEILQNAIISSCFFVLLTTRWVLLHMQVIVQSRCHHKSVTTSLRILLFFLFLCALCLWNQNHGKTYCMHESCLRMYLPSPPARVDRIIIKTSWDVLNSLTSFRRLTGGVLPSNLKRKRTNI